MILQEEKGGYARGLPVRLYGSFRINGTSTPDAVRDGQSKCVASVARVSAGLFTVTFDAGFPIPERLVSWRVSMARAAVPTQEVTECNMVVDSYSQSTRSFQIATVDGADGSNAAVDPDDNDQIAWEIVGSISSVGTDPA